MDNKTSPLSWQKVEKYLSEKTTSGNLMALIETEKIFQEVLKKLKFPGRTINQKTESLKFVISDFGKFKESRGNYLAAISDLNFEIDAKTIEEALGNYYKAIEEIIVWQDKKHNMLLKLKMWLAAYFDIANPRKLFKKILAYFIVFFFVIFLLDSTRLGRSLTTLLVRISHFLFSWVLFALLLIIGVIIIAIGVIFYLESRKKERIKKISNV